MEKKRRRFYFIPFFIIGFVLALSAAVMLLWNSVVKDIFNVKAITYSQAIGLFILSKLLFGFPRPGGFRRGGPPWRNKLLDLSQEEREAFKKEWQKRNQDRTT